MMPMLVNVERDLPDELLNYFRSGEQTYYGQKLFYISIILHRLQQFSDLHKCIMIDSDLKFNADIHELWKEFDTFKSTELLALAYEQQPVYRNIFRWVFPPKILKNKSRK
jgi:hypothetical protein